MKVFLSLILLTIIYIIGILLFTGGFLLRKIIINANSSCNPEENATCAMNARYNKAVIIVIDALRYDFLSYNYSDNFTAAPYENKFKKTAELLRNKPENTRLYRFVADPPTTTLQRLKGLTTGSLPTFVDAGTNFGKNEISEDNFIDQLKSLNKSIVFIGDDTWTGLYPDRFSKSFPYPSFNVKDLHTVDNGVISHLVPELQGSNWDLLIAHTLGVDHCGHTYGPNHPAMEEKLTQMDDFIDLVIKNLDNETIMFVMGDHGMTKTGDHGGDSTDEVEAGLLIYSNKPLGRTIEGEEDRTLSQVDFVATFSLLYGLPIPYQNLGIVITDLFRYYDKDVGDCDNPINEELNILKALHLNSLQVHRYVEAYANVSATFDNNDLQLFSDWFNKIESDYGDVKLKCGSPSDLKDLQSKYQNYLLSVRLLLHRKWAQFDMVSMLLGLIIFVMALLVNSCFVFFDDVVFSCKLLSFVVLCFLVSLYLSCCGLQLFSLLLLLVGFLILLLRFFCKMSIFNIFLSRIYSNFRNISSLVMWFVYIISFLSNSFIVYEGYVTSFLLQSCLYIQFSTVVYNHLSTSFVIGNKSSKNSKLTTGRPILLLGFLVMLANFFLGISKLFHSCRDEQVDCQESWIVQSPLEVGEMGSLKRNQLLLSVSTALFVYCLIYRWLRKNGNMNGWSPVVVICKYVTFTAFIFVISYWCLTVTLKSNQTHPNIFALSAAQSVYLFVAFSLAIVITRPLCIFVIKQSPSDVGKSLNSAILNSLLLGGGSSQEIVPQIFHQLRANWMMNKMQASDDEPKMYVYGLTTVLSSPLIVVLLVFSILLMMLLDVSVAPSMFLLLAVGFCLLEFHSIQIRLDSKKFLSHVPISSIILMLLLSSERFYSFGHHPTISSIRWEAAYHGFDGNFNFYSIPAILICLNTFASQIMVTLALPLLIYWPLTRGSSSQKRDSNEKVSEVNGFVETSEDEGGNVKGEFVLCEENNKSIISQVCLKTILLVGLKLLGLMICVTIHRRHLMVWKIFAPRFIYETVAFLIVTFISLLNYLFYLQTLRTSEKFVSGLQ